MPTCQSTAFYNYVLAYSIICNIYLSIHWGFWIFVLPIRSYLFIYFVLRLMVKRHIWSKKKPLSDSKKHKQCGLNPLVSWPLKADQSVATMTLPEVLSSGPLPYGGCVCVCEWDSCMWSLVPQAAVEPLTHPQHSHAHTVLLPPVASQHVARQG